MTEALELWQLITVLVGVCSAVLGPAVWFFKHNTSRIESENEKFITKFENSSTESFKSIKEDLKDFRRHFDHKISEVYVAVDSKNRELKEFVSKELDFIKEHIKSVEGRVHDYREQSHEIEKKLLKLESLLSKDYITREDLYEYLKMRNPTA